MSATVLIVDDEIDLLRLVRYNLEKEGFKVVTALDGAGTLSQFALHRPDLLVLDLMLPDMSGVEICQQIKRNPATKDTPIIMLTARSSESDRVRGFEAGADDYVVKPFSPRELVLRVKAMLGRTLKPKSGNSPGDSSVIELGDVFIHPRAHSVETRNGHKFNLSFLEFRILMVLAEAPNIVKSREQLIGVVWEQDGEDISDRTVDTHIKRLRKKLGEAKDLIETIRGVGYRVVPVKLASGL